MVVFSSERDGQPLDVYLADRAGNVRRVTNRERTGTRVGPRWASRERADIWVFFPSQVNDSERPRYVLGGLARFDVAIAPFGFSGRLTY
jgi:hypothetical protein